MTQKHRKLTIAEGRHPFTGYTNVVDEAARALINIGVDTAGNPGVDGVVRQTAGTTPGYYAALATGAGLDKWEYLGALPASETVAGKIEIATQAEVDAGVDGVRAVTPATLATRLTAALVGLLDFKGSTDCSTNPNYPAASAGDVYRVSVAGKIGGASGTSVDLGDFYVALADNAGGTEAAVGTSWEQWDAQGAYQPLDTDLTALAAIAGVQGDVIYRDGTQWQRLAAGTSGHFLKTLGAGADPAWAASGGLRATGALGSQASAVTPDLSTADNFTVTLTGHAMLNFTNSTDGQGGTIVVTQDATGGRRLSINTNVRAPGGILWITAAANAVSVVHYRIVGSIMYAWVQDPVDYVPTRTDRNGFLAHTTALAPNVIFWDILDEAYIGEATYITESGGAVSQWSGAYNARHMVQATAGKKPTWNASDANFNNRGSLTFDGGDHLQAATFKTYVTKDRPGLVAVCRSANALIGTDMFFAGIANAGNVGKFQIGADAAADKWYGYIVAGDAADQLIAVALTTAKTLVETYADTTLELHVDGVRNIMAAFDTNTGLDSGVAMKADIGANAAETLFLTGAIAEVCYLSAVPSELQRRQYRERTWLLFGIDY